MGVSLRAVRKTPRPKKCQLSSRGLCFPVKNILLSPPGEASAEEDTLKKAPDAENAMLAESGERPERPSRPKNARDSRTGPFYRIAIGLQAPKTLQGPSGRGGEHGPT